MFCVSAILLKMLACILFVKIIEGRKSSCISDVLLGSSEEIGDCIFKMCFVLASYLIVYLI